MSGPLFSAAWYRVAALTPRIRSHARFHRHRYWGETWYVLRDLASDRVYRFSPAGYFVVGLMDGRRTVQEIWEAAAGQLGDDAPTQDEFIQLLGQLHGADVLRCDVPPDTQELLDRHLRQERSARLSPWLSPFSWRFPLLDPERLLTALLPIVRPLMGIGGGLLWLVTVGAGVLLAAMHWGDLTRNVLDRLFATRSLLLLWVLFPCLKTLHEFGHAVTIKALGGEVHDLGLMLLVFTPVPYVDATGTAAFVSKWHRVAVGVAGMAVELFVAALAILVWVAAEPGTVRTLAYHAILMAGATTLLFNANPLLRYDGYYILADLIEIPNLYTRARTYVSFLTERYLFGQREAEFPPAPATERGILAVYAVASAAYRVLVVVGIGFFLMNRFFYLGLALTAGAAVSWGIVPLVKESAS
jgi:putative peptide zinc metalloprotease protein